ncbi:hypothetical protein ACHAWF_006610 [Thalassiosira exigua]
MNQSMLPILFVVAVLSMLQLASQNVEAFSPSAVDSYYHAIPSVITYPSAFVAAFRTGAALSVIDQPRIPPVDSAVGSSVMRLPSGARLRLFYPTKSSTGDMSPYCTDGRQTSDGMAALVGFKQIGISFLLGHLADASSGCIQDAPTIDLTSGTSDNSLPLLVYSHGFGGNMDMATYFFRTMASKGIIIAALEHTDGTASSTVLEDGSERRFNEYFMTGRQQLMRRASELLESAEFLPKEIERRYNATVGTVMLGGHSFGAPSAVMAANGAPEQSNIKGLILHDPALGMGYGMLPPNGAKSKIPTVSYVSDEYNRANVRYGDTTVHVRGCFHGNFVDAPLWAPNVVMRALSLVIPAAGPADSVAVHQQLAESAIAFFESQDPMSKSVRGGDLLKRV